MPGPHHFFTPSEPVVRPTDPAVRRAHLRRIGGLFRPYWPKLSVVTTIIFVSSALGVIPAFIIKELFNTAIPEGRLGLTTALVAVAIAISIRTGAFGVVPADRSPQGGPRGMPDLRAPRHRPPPR